jgi:hypothetical protein
MNSFTDFSLRKVMTAFMARLGLRMIRYPLTFPFFLLFSICMTGHALQHVCIVMQYLKGEDRCIEQNTNNNILQFVSRDTPQNVLSCRAGSFGE